MKLHHLFILCLSLILSNHSFANENKFENYHVIFENGNEYNVKIGKDYLSWRGMTGTEKGQEDEIKNFQHLKLRPGVDVYQWVSQKASFNVVVVDQDKLKIIASGTNKNEYWFWNGKLKPVV